MLKLDTVTGSGAKTASAVIFARPCSFAGLTIATDGTNAVTVDVYDNATAATGTKLIPTWIVPTSSANRIAALEFLHMKRCENGIYVNISVAGGGACSYTVDYIEGGSMQ